MYFEIIGYKHITMAGYFKNIAEGVKSTLTGMGLTFRHAVEARKRRKVNNIQLNSFFEVSTGMVTVQYPKESVPIPDNGRYRLHNEMDDCIVCDKCAKVCPVDCIEIEPIKATEEVGRASDGSVIRLYAAKFDIDMAKCCYCGLCTTVCPTECLTMTKTFDYSEFDVREMVYAYGNLSPQEAQEKKDLLEQFQMEKLQAKSKAAAPEIPAPTVAKPAFKPVMKPRTTTPTPAESTTATSPAQEKTGTRFNPKNWSPEMIAATMRLHFTLKPKTTPPAQEKSKTETTKPAFRPTMKPGNVTDAEHPVKTGKPAFKPTMKPQGPTPNEVENKKEATKTGFRPTIKPKNDAEAEQSATATKPAFKPTMKPKGSPPDEVENKKEAPKTGFRPTMKPKNDAEAEQPSTTAKPAFKPTMKPQGPKPNEVENKKEVAKTGFRPTMKPKSDAVAEQPATAAKPAFRPTKKPQTVGVQDDRVQTGNKAGSPADKPKTNDSGIGSGTRSFKPSEARKEAANMPVESLPVFAPSGNTPARKTPKVEPVNSKFNPAHYQPVASAERPAFGLGLTGSKKINTATTAIPDRNTEEEAKMPKAPRATEERPKTGFRPTMKPKK